jgi:hypothetical protein
MPTRTVKDDTGRRWECKQVGTSGPVGSPAPYLVGSATGLDATLECRSAPNKSPVLVKAPPNWEGMPERELVELILCTLGPER